MADITKHEGSKYLKRIVSPLPAQGGQRPSFMVDVYAVLTAFDVTCPAIAHCVKKLLMPGQRGKGNKMADLKGAMAALNRAIELEEDRTTKTRLEPVLAAPKAHPLEAGGGIDPLATLPQLTAEEKMELMRVNNPNGYGTGPTVVGKPEQKPLDPVPVEELSKRSGESAAKTRDLLKNMCDDLGIETVKEAIGVTDDMSEVSQAIADAIRSRPEGETMEPKYPLPPEQGN